MRDDFSAATKTLLAKRVGYRCSNTFCNRLTIGAGITEDKAVSIGVAAHIKAAAPGGPRYDPYMSKEARKSPSNGIWLCQSCSKLIDSDPEKYTADVLYDWKHQSEQRAAEALDKPGMANVGKEDIALIRFYVQCLDRPAILEPMRLLIRKHDPELLDFESAIRDTVVALNTGVQRTRDGDIIKVAEGKSGVLNPEWNQKLCKVVSLLIQIVHELKWCRREIESVYRIERLIEQNRREVVDIINSICDEAGIMRLQEYW